MLTDVITENIKKSIQEQISKQIDKEIEEKVKQLYDELTDRKDEYIAQIMKGIRVYSEYDHLYNQMNYKIVFENINRIEVK